MLIGVPKEIKNKEFRVGMTPSSVREVVAVGHQVIVESECGNGIGADDDLYRAAGAEVVDTAAEVFAKAKMVVKVKEPQAVERAMLREGQVLFTYLHLAPDPVQAKELVESGATCIAYETVTGSRGGLPLLVPMSEVAGRMSVQAGAHHLEKAQGGRGVLLGQVPGVDRARVVIIGGGTVGRHAADVAIGMGAEVCIIDNNIHTLNSLWSQFGSRINTVFSTRDAIEKHCHDADLVVGGVLIPGASAPKLIDRQIVKTMNPGSVIVDVAIDQGGCAETSHPTTYDDPVFIDEQVIHYCVANMPGGVPRSSTYALNHSTLPYIQQIAKVGWKQAISSDPHLANGLNVHAGKVTCRPVAEELGYEYVAPTEAIANS